MNTVVLVYKTDSHHSYASRDIIGIATNKTQALHICREQARKEGERLDDEDNDQIYNLHTLHQTQGYSGEGEFQFEEMMTNTLL